MDREEKLRREIENNSLLLYRLVYQILENREDTEDVLQETFLRFYRKGMHLENEEQCKAWLIRVASNNAFDVLRSPWRKRRSDWKENQQTLQKHEALEELFLLEPRDRQILYLYYYEGYKIREIADILKESHNTVSSKLQRARGKLKLLLEESEHEENNVSSID